MKSIRICLCAYLLLAISHLHAATIYYVDFEHGSDANNGTSTATPWKRVKGMANVAGTAASATIAAGDKIVFRRGIAWTNSWPWVLTSSGTAVSPIIYESESAWATNSGEFPIFDFENVQLGGFYTGAGVQITTKSNINFNHLEFTRFSGVTNSAAGSSYGNTTIVLASARSTIRFTNCYIHDWDTQYEPVSPGALVDDGSGGISFVSTDGGSGEYIFHGCQLHQTNKNRRTGFAFSSIGGTFVSNTVHGVGGGFNGSGLYLRNHIYNMTAHTDAQQHGDAIICQSIGSVINGNFIHDIAVGVCIWVGGTGSTGTNYVINNIISNSSPSAITVSTDPVGGVEQGAFVLNNTIQSSSLCLFVSPQNGGTTLNWLQAQNNLFITASQTIAIDGTGGSGNVDAKQISHNLTNTVATAATWGATAGNRFKTTIAGSPTINSGTNVLAYVTVDADGISRPQEAAFDIGAHEYVVPSGPAITLGLGTTLGAGTTIR